MSSAETSIPTQNTRGYVWLFVLSTLYAFLFSPYLADMMRPGFNAYDYFLGDDFQNIWTSARLVAEGKISTLFDLQAYQQELPFKSAGFNWSYPLHLLILVLPLGFLSYVAAYAAWNAGGLAVMTATIAKHAPRLAMTAITLLTLTSPAAITNFVTGQTGFFTAAIFLGGFFFLRRGKQIPAGILFGILTVKPQLGLIIPFALLVLRQWKAIGAAVATTLLLIGISFVIWGVEPWQKYLELNGVHLFAIHRDLPNQPGSYLMGSIYAGLRNSGLDFSISMIIQVIVSVATVAFTCLMLRKEGLTNRTLLLLALGAIMVTPYAHGYDYTMIAGALLLYAFGRADTRTLAREMAEYVSFSLAWALPLLTWIFKIHAFPLIPVILIAAYACVYTASPSENGKTK